MDEGYEETGGGEEWEMRFVVFDVVRMLFDVVCSLTTVTRWLSRILWLTRQGWMLLKARR